MRFFRQSIQAIKNHFVPSESNAYRPHLLRRSWLLFFLAITLGAEGFLVANIVARQTDKDFLAAVVPGEVIALTNARRQEQKLGTVVPNEMLAQAAQAKAEDMAARGYFSHNGPDGKAPWQWIAEAGYPYQYAGENLAVRFIDSQDVVNAWMQSPTHRDNIVKPVYTEIGIGVAQGLYQGEMATYVVQYFAAPLTPEEAPPAVAAAQSATAAEVQQEEVITPTAPASPPQVQGASAAATAASQSNAFTQQVARILQSVFANPQQSTAVALGSVATVLSIVLVLTFFVRLQVQPTNMLASGTVVAALALGFLGLNSQLVEVPLAADQAARVIESVHPGSVIIGPTGESVEYALFPETQ